MNRVSRAVFSVFLLWSLSLSACSDDTRVREDTGTTVKLDSGFVPNCTGVMGPEDNAAACLNGCDDDQDGFTDCIDFDCANLPECQGAGDGGTNNSDGGSGGDSGPSNLCPGPPAPEDNAAACSNGCDDDGNGFVDCLDFDCAGTPSCPVENSNPRCSDGMDNDNDGMTDCADFDCNDLMVCSGEAANNTCSDGMDNDNDGMTDCDDPGCQVEAIVVCENGAPASPLPNSSQWAALVQARCSNQVDDDMNGFTDCGDFGCSDSHLATNCQDLPREGSNATCSDMVDNDQDGLTDCDDPACDREGIVVCMGTTPVMPADVTAAANLECSDTMDNDANNFTDCDDFGCSQDPSVTICPVENTDALCSDGMDNDNNTFTDCADFSCSRNRNVTVCPHELTFAECSNGIDDDGNGFVDCDDNACNPPNGNPNTACR